MYLIHQLWLSAATAGVLGLLLERLTRSRRCPKWAVTPSVLLTLGCYAAAVGSLTIASLILFPVIPALYSGYPSVQ